MSKKLKEYSREEIFAISRRYAKNYVSLEGVAYEFDITPTMCSNIMYRGIAEDILSNSVSDEIFNKIVYSSQIGVYQRRNRWEAAFDERNRTRDFKKHNSLIQQRIEEIQNHIKSLDSYALDEEGAPTKENLISEVARLERQLVPV